MFKSLFAVSGFASMAGLVAICAGTGCSDDATQTASSATEPDNAGQAPPPKAPAPAAPPADDGNTKGDGTEAPKTCMDTTPFDATTVPYRSPAVKAGSCTAADIKVFDDYMSKNPQAPATDVQEAMTKQNERCSDCIFGTTDADTWAPIVLDAKTATLNGGGCVSVVSGKDACGKAYQQWNTCLNTVCATCSDATEHQQCTDDGQQKDGPCGEASDTLFSACGAKVNDYLKKCFGSGVGRVVEQLCGTPAKDGGA